MKTVDKAMSVLDQFSLDRMEIGLSELSRMAGLDKAATRRLLVALANHGYIEQAADTKKYRLGYGFLRLARIREATVPIVRAAQEVCDWLVEQVNETAHVSIPGVTGMTTIAHRLPRRGNVINIEPSEILYYHATASGLVFLAFADDDTATRILALKREKVTDATITSRKELQDMVSTFRKQGYSHTRNTFEYDVSSIAMAFFDEGKNPTGAIAIALPKNDLTHERCGELLPTLKTAVQRMEQALTGM